MQNERKLKGLETHLELVQDDPLEMASEVFEGDYFDCAESNDYLKLLKDWRESVNKFGMSDLSNHLYPLKYSIDLDGNNDPRDIQLRSRLYSPYSANSANLDFSFHYRARAYTIEDFHILRVHLRKAKDISSKSEKAQDSEDHFSKKWMSFLEAGYVEKGHRRSKREYVDRKIAAIPTLFYIQKHLFCSDVTDSDSDQPEQAPRACGAKKQKKDQEAIQNDEFPRGPRDMCNIVLAAAGFNLLKEREYPDTMEWIDNFVSGNFPQHYANGKKPKASDRMYVKEREMLYSGEDDELFDSDDDEFDEDEFGGRDMPRCRSM